MASPPPKREDSPGAEKPRDSSLTNGRSRSPRRSTSKNNLSRSRSRSRRRSTSRDRRRRSRSWSRSRRRRSRSGGRRRSNSRGRRNNSNGGKKCFVGNLEPLTDEVDLEERFAPYGQLEDIYVPRDRSNRANRGYAFITFFDKRDAEDACREDGEELRGRRIGVNLAKPRPGGDRQARTYVPSRDGIQGSLREIRQKGSEYDRRGRSRSRSRSRRRYRSRSNDRSRSR